MVDILFGLNLLVAVVLGAVLLWREKLRAKVVFHVVGLSVAVALYAVMIVTSAATEIEPDRIPAWFFIRLIVGVIVYLPFLIFLVVTYVRVLGSVADGGIETTRMKLEDAEQASRFGHNNRAVKILREVLDVDPDNVEARVIMAKIQLKRGHYSEAIGSYRLAMSAAKSDEQIAELVFKTAVILNESLGDARAACRELDIIRQRMPESPEAKKAQEWIVRIMDEAAREEGS